MPRCNKCKNKNAEETLMSSDSITVPHWLNIRGIHISMQMRLCKVIAMIHQFCLTQYLLSDVAIFYFLRCQSTIQADFTTVEHYGILYIYPSKTNYSILQVYDRCWLHHQQLSLCIVGNVSIWCFHARFKHYKNEHEQYYHSDLWIRWYNVVILLFHLSDDMVWLNCYHTSVFALWGITTIMKV